MTRAIRRHHRERLKKNRRFWYGRDLDKEPKALGIVINTPCQCSCFLCAKKRKYFGQTVQEKREEKKHDKSPSIYRD